MEKHYLQELEEHISNHKVKEAMDLIEWMKLEKIDTAKYEQQILSMTEETMNGVIEYDIEAQNIAIVGSTQPNVVNRITKRIQSFFG
jgi:hypothetical protein